MKRARPAPSSPSRWIAELEPLLARWVEAGLLSRAQSDAISHYERAESGRVAAPSPRVARRTGVRSVAEALGYLGGMLATIGLVLAIAQYWPDLALAGRLGISAAGAVALLVAGWLVPEHAEPALARLRWFLWLASTAATGLFAGVLAVDGFDAGTTSTVAVVAAATASLSGVLWAWRQRPLQELAFLAATAVLCGALTAEVAPIGASGLAVWGIGALYLAAGIRRRVPLPVLVTAAGSLAVVLGAALTTNWPAFGLPFGVATALGLSALAAVAAVALERPDRLVVGIVGGLALLEAVPSTLGYFARDSGLVTGMTTWLVGAVLFTAGMRAVVRRPLLTEVFGCAVMIGGAALTGVQTPGVAPLFGIATAVGLIALGMVPGHVVLSACGSLALMINVPWATGHFFPGGRAPLLVLVSGVVILAVAILLARMGGRFRRELGHPTPPDTATEDPGNMHNVHLGGVS
jgi:hypothetical protein